MNGLMRRALLAAITAVAMTGALAAPASAGILTASAKDCGDESLSQPFASSATGRSTSSSRAATSRVARRLDADRRREGRVGQRAVEGRRLGSRQVARPAGAAAASHRAGVRGPRRADAALLRQEEQRLCSRRSWCRSTSRRRSASSVPVPVGVVLGNGQWKATPPMLISRTCSRCSRATGRRSRSSSPRCWVTGRSTTCTSIRCGCARRPQRARSFRLRVRSSCFSTTLRDQLEDLGRAGGPDGAGLERLAPVPDRALAGELVEVRARDREADLRVGRDVACVIFGPGTSTRKSWMSPRPRSSSSITSLSFSSAGTSFWKLAMPSSMRAFVSAVRHVSDVTNGSAALPDPRAARRRPRPRPTRRRSRPRSRCPAAACSAGRYAYAIERSDGVAVAAAGDAPDDLAADARPARCRAPPRADRRA